MSSLDASRDNVTVAIPQHLIDRALLQSGRATSPIVSYDEGPSIERPLRVDREDRPFGLGILMLLGAIVGSLVVFTGMQVADSHAPATQAQSAVSSGVQTMSAAELVQSVRAENRPVYWLTSRQGDSYTNSTSDNGIDQIFYRPAGANVSNLNQFEVNVGTYKDYSTYDAQPHPLLGANGITVALPSGASVTYNKASTLQAVVQFPNTPEVVVINYPGAQAVPTIITDAESLVPIS